MRVYIAGHDQEHDRSEFEQAARRLARFGAEVSSPFHPDLGDAPGSWSASRIAHILRSDAVVALPARGFIALDESLAREAGIPVAGLDEVLSTVAGLQVA